MGTTIDYFSEKKPWSFLKDALLECYLPPYLAKLAKKGQDIYIIDCFAGKGKFDDGNNGSPLIIIDAIETALQRDPKLRIKPIFIEQKYAADLKKNLSNYPYCEIVEGRFEDNFNRFREICEQATVLLYIDPFGIKSLDSIFFKELVDISKRAGTSFEMLLNLNTFGFLREGCRLIKPNVNLCELVDTDAFYEGEIESKEKMNRIAGGVFWEKLVMDYYNRGITFAQLENCFIRGYLEHLGLEMGWKGFTYVLETPIKDKKKNVPKYRIIFGTNHIDGAILMADNMNRRWNKFLEHDQGGQITLLFEILTTTEDKAFTWGDVDEVILKQVQNFTGVRVEKMLVNVWEKFGIAISKKEIEERVWHLYRLGKLDISWDPPTTPAGNLPKTLDYKRYKKITLIKGSGGRGLQDHQSPSNQLNFFD